MATHKGWFARLMDGIMNGFTPARDEKIHMENVTTQSSFQVEVVDEQTGEKKTYNRLEDVPPEIRAKLEEARQSASIQVTRTHEYRVVGPDGREHTYHSLEEMPAEVRTMFEKYRPKA